MEYKEAVEALKLINTSRVHPFYNWEEMSEVRDIAIQAIEKQIPKKPDYEADGYDDKGELIYDTWICPNCEKRYEVDCDSYDYCPNCGQAIDWSDRNE